jgi:peptidylprolyl isomerase
MPTRSQATRRATAATTGLILTAGLAACGSSKLAGITPAPAAGLTSAPSTPSTPATTTTTPTTPTVTPPPALAKKPVVNVPKTPAPKNLVVTDLVKGTGKVAVTGDRVTVNYVGVLYNSGKEFDSSWTAGRPVTLPLKYPGGVIQGFAQGISGMHIGGRRELIIPPNLAYGGKNYPQTVGPNATLVFVVDLLAIG